MPLDVELKLKVANHTHAGRRCVKGDIIATNPDRAARMIAMGFADKVGVRSRTEAVAEAPNTGAEDSVGDEVIEIDDVEDDEEN